MSKGTLNVQVGNNQDKLDKERDALGSFHVVHEFFGFSCSRKEAYAADITYGTNNEFGFDYLRDNITLTMSAILFKRRIRFRHRGRD